MHFAAGGDPQFAARIGQPHQGQHLRDVSRIENRPCCHRGLSRFSRCCRRHSRNRCFRRENGTVPLHLAVQADPRNRQQKIHRHGLGPDRRQFEGQIDHVGVFLAHADDAARADFHARLAHRPQGVEAVLVCVRGADAG